MRNFLLFKVDESTERTLAKLGLTIFHEVKGALERSFIVIRDESFPSEHPQDSYNQPQV